MHSIGLFNFFFNLARGLQDSPQPRDVITDHHRFAVIALAKIASSAHTQGIVGAFFKQAAAVGSSPLEADSAPPKPTVI
jgi:hypothetical protein